MYRVLLVAQQVDIIGGVQTMLSFLYDVLQDAPEFDVRVASLALSSRDDHSVRLFRPNTWRRGIKISDKQHQDMPFMHVGARLTEFECCRYLPRQRFDQLMEEFDLIQVVAGSPALGYVASRTSKPSTLFVATTVKQERGNISFANPLKTAWTKMMSRVVGNIEIRSVKNINHVFAESEYTSELIRHLDKQVAMTVALPGVDTHQFYPNEIYQEHGPILFVGRLSDKRKNIGLLLNAYSRAKRSLPNLPPLVLAGRGTLLTQDQQLIDELQLQNEVTVKKDLSLDELASIYRSASLFVLPSLEEGLGIVLLEALASGLPVISTRCGGPESCVQDGITGYLTAVDDIDDMTSRLVELLSNRELRLSMRQQGLADVAKRFAKECAAEEYLRVYRRLLAKA